MISCIKNAGKIEDVLDLDRSFSVQGGSELLRMGFQRLKEKSWR